MLGRKKTTFLGYGYRLGNHGKMRVYNHTYAECPGYTVDDQLRETRGSAPFCVDC